MLLILRFHLKIVNQCLSHGSQTLTIRAMFDRIHKCKTGDSSSTTFRMGDEGTTSIVSKAEGQNGMGGERGAATYFRNDSTSLQLQSVSSRIESDPIGVHAIT